MRKLKILYFWIIAFCYILWYSLIKNKTWHMIIYDFHIGDTKEGFPIRERWIAKQSVDSFDIYRKY
jgi:hypothetical protein